METSASKKESTSEEQKEKRKDEERNEEQQQKKPEPRTAVPDPEAEEENPFGGMDGGNFKKNLGCGG